MNSLYKKEKTLARISWVVIYAMFFNAALPFSVFATGVDQVKTVPEGHWENGYFDDNNWLEEQLDTKSGNISFTEKRLSVPCPGISLDFNLTYNSVSEHPGGSLGAHWTHSYDWQLADQGSGPGKELYTPDGDKLVFDYDAGAEEYAPVSGWTLTNLYSGTYYRLDKPGGKSYWFSSYGQLIWIEDAWGNQAVCWGMSGDTEGEIAHGNGRKLIFSNHWNSALQEWRIDSVAAENGASLTFSYDSNGQFTQIVERVDNNSYTSSYQYAYGFLTNRVDAAGFEYAYDYAAGSTGKCSFVSVDGNQEHEVDYVSDSVTDVFSTMRGMDQWFRYSRDTTNGALIAKYGPVQQLQDIEDRGTSCDYTTNGLKKTLFDDPSGESWSDWIQKDDLGRMTNYAVSYCSTNPVQQVAVEYDSRWGLPSVYESAAGARTEMIYTNGLIATVKAFHSPTQSYDTHIGYTAEGQLRAVTNANGHTVELEYNAMGDMISIVPEIGPSITNTYNARGDIETLEIVSENGESTGRFYEIGTDAHGRLTEIDYPDGSSESYARNAQGLATNAVNRAGYATDYTYGSTGQVTSVTQYLLQGGSNIPVRIAYDLDEQANVLRISEPRGRYVESYQMDFMDRVTAVTNIEGQVMSIDYGVGSFVNRITRFDGSKITNSYNSAGYKTTVSYIPAGQTNASLTVSQDYYADGMLKTISDETSSISNRYNGLNWKTSVETASPDYESTVSYQHDAVGNVTNTVIFCADLDGTPSSGMTNSFSYDEAERFQTSGDTVYTYHPANGRLASVSNTVSGIYCAYTYDIMDRIESMTYRKASGELIRSINYQYDALGMITSKVIDSGTQKTKIGYQYDSINRLVAESRTDSAFAPTTTFYAYDLAGNRTAKTLSEAEVAYSTIGVGNRLEGWSVSASNGVNHLRRRISGSSSEPVGTDPRWGQVWVSNTVTGASAFPGVNGNSFYTDQIGFESGTQSLVAAVRDQAGNMGYVTNTVTCSLVTNALYAYNAAGCTTNITHQGPDNYSSSLSLGWNEQYQLTSAARDSEFNIQYGYDLLGRRTSRTQGGTNEYYVYDRDHVAFDLDGSRYLKRSYAYGPGIDNILSMTIYPQGSTNGTTYYYIKDHQNTVLALTDSFRNIIESYDYDAWGRVLSVKDATGDEITSADGFPTSGIGNRYTFQGREIDWETGLYYFRARWYNPVSGRWLSKDPIGLAGGLNQYIFCANNPVNYLDPTGLSEMSDGDVGLAAVGGAILVWASRLGLKGTLWGLVIDAFIWKVKEAIYIYGPDDEEDGDDEET